MEGEHSHWLPDVLVRGAWGEHAVINNDFNGGPVCAAQSTIEFKFIVTLICVSVESYELTWWIISLVAWVLSFSSCWSTQALIHTRTKQAETDQGKQTHSNINRKDNGANLHWM